MKLAGFYYSHGKGRIDSYYFIEKNIPPPEKNVLIDIVAANGFQNKANAIAALVELFQQREYATLDEFLNKFTKSEFGGILPIFQD